MTGNHVSSVRHDVVSHFSLFSAGNYRDANLTSLFSHRYSLFRPISPITANFRGGFRGSRSSQDETRLPSCISYVRDTNPPLCEFPVLESSSAILDGRPAIIRPHGSTPIAEGRREVKEEQETKRCLSRVRLTSVSLLTRILITRLYDGDRRL